MIQLFHIIFILCECSRHFQGSITWRIPSVLIFLREMFYSVAWTTLFVELADPPQINILAAAGARGTLHLIHPQGGVAFFEYQIIRSKTVTLSSLLFHPKQCSILFCKCYFSTLKTGLCISSSSRGQENGIKGWQPSYVYILLYYVK